jgi:ribosome-associated protein
MAGYDSSAMQDDLVSKTQRKRQMHELQELGAALVELPESQLRAMALDEELARAVLEARRIASREAKRRQLQYVGRLMRGLDPEPIRAMLARVTGRGARTIARHRRLEAWRERLMDDDAALTEFAADHPGADLQALRALIRTARREAGEGRPPRAYRELFRMIREAAGESL